MAGSSGLALKSIGWYRLLGFEKRQQVGIGREAAALAVDQSPQPARREAIVDAVVVVDRQADLLEVVLALGASGRFARRLHGRQQQSDQHADDGDDHQQFDERKATSPGKENQHGHLR